MVRAGLGFLAAADATQLTAETQAECLQMLEQVTAMGTAARTSILAAFTSAQGYCADADYSPRAWLINKTRITRGAAVSYTAWVRRAAAHPQVAQLLAAGELSSPTPGPSAPGPTSSPRTAGRTPTRSCSRRPGPGWTCRTWPRWPRRSTPGPGPAPPTRTRTRRSRTAPCGSRPRSRARACSADLTPECAAVVGAVLDALSAPAGAEDTRSQAQRYHDGLQEAMRRLVAAGLLPERAGQPVKAWVHISLADLLLLEGDSALQEEWTAGVRARWAAHRAAASAGGSDGGAWLDGDAAAAVACDAAMAPIVTGEVNPAALEDLIWLCVQLDKLRYPDRGPGPGPGTDPGSPGGPGSPASDPGGPASDPAPDGGSDLNAGGDPGTGGPAPPPTPRGAWRRWSRR